MNFSSINCREGHCSHHETSKKVNECRCACELQDLEVANKKPIDTLDLLLDFVSSLMERNYGKSLQLCKEVIDREPWNKLALQFYPLLQEKYAKDLDQEQRGSNSSDGASSSSSSSASSVSDSKSSSDDDGSGTDDSTDGHCESDSDTDTEELSRSLQTTLTGK